MGESSEDSQICRGLRGPNCRRNTDSTMIEGFFSWNMPSVLLVIKMALMTESASSEQQQ